MNTKQILIGVALIMITFLTSCQQDELLYSCDREINKWATLNAEEIKSMTKSQFLDLDASYQRAAYNAFSPQQRMNLWKTKFEETLQLAWTASERIHIETLLNTIEKNIDWFNNSRSQEVMDNIAIETYRWIDVAINDLLWDVETIYAISGTPLPIFIKDGKFAIAISQSLRDSYGQNTITRAGECGCHAGNILSDLNCAITTIDTPVCQKSDQCSPLPIGCGTVWLQECDGLCGSPIGAK